MKKASSIKKPNLIHLSLLLLISFCCYCCGPEKDENEPPEKDTSSSTIVYSEKHLDYEISIDRITNTSNF